MSSSWHLEAIIDEHERLTQRLRDEVEQRRLPLSELGAALRAIEEREQQEAEEEARAEAEERARLNPEQRQPLSHSATARPEREPANSGLVVPIVDDGTEREPLSPEILAAIARSKAARQAGESAVYPIDDPGDEESEYYRRGGWMD